jgi:hypothetical protein
MLCAVTQGDGGLVKRSNWVEFIQCDKVTAKMSRHVVVKTLISLCETVKVLNS